MGIKTPLTRMGAEKQESYPSWVRGLKNGGRKDEQRRI